MWIHFCGKGTEWKKCCILANEQLAKLLPALKVKVTVILEPGDMLQGDEEHPLMVMFKASYLEPVTKHWKWVLSVQDAGLLIFRRAATGHTMYESESLNNFESQ